MNKIVFDEKAYVNELRPEYLGIHALNFAAKHNSGSRAVMFGSHFSQRIVLIESDMKRTQTGVEQEMGKYTFSSKMPVNAKVLKVLQRYPSGVSVDSLDFNPETLVFYEDEETHEIDFITIPYHKSLHQTFGFRNVINNNVSKIRPGSNIPKGMIFADSPGVAKNNNYMYGRSLETAFMSLPATAEDGFIIARSALQKFKHHTYETRSVSCGANQFPLNIYGTLDFYKAFPDIGEPIREDGRLMVLRQYDNELSPVEMSIYDTMEPNFYFDEPVYTRAGKGRIVDIQIVSNNNPVKQMPELMSMQMQKYVKAKQRFHREIVDFEKMLRTEQKKKYGESRLKLSPKLSSLVVKSMAITNHTPISEKNRHLLNLIYRKEPVDEFRIEFTIEYENIPDIGYKLADIHGGKGVIVKIEEDENMPVDAAGNRAELICDPVATLNRMNLARLHEHYHAGAARDITVMLRQMLNVTNKVTKEQLEGIDHQVFERTYQTLLRYYDMVSDRQYKFFRDLPKELKIQHMFDVCSEGIYTYIPVENDKVPMKMIRDIQNNFPLVYGPVRYTGNSGRPCTTVKKIRIAPLYVMLLDKTPTEWSSTTTAKLQHFGILTPLTKSEKFSRPYRNSAPRTIGETESRIYRCYAPPRLITELRDRSNNPQVQKHMTYRLLTEPQPGNIDRLVDRDVYEYGEDKALGMIKHIFSCRGFKITYVPECPTIGGH